MKNKIVGLKERGIALVFASNRKDKFTIINCDEDLIKEIEKYTWTYNKHNKTKEYFKTGANNYYLHQFVMDYYFSKGKRQYMKKQGYVIDHLSNYGLDNRIENLQYLTRGENSSKQYIDGRVKKINDGGIWYIYYIRESVKGDYYMTIRDNFSGKCQSYVYGTYEDFKHDIKLMIPLIEENKEIPFYNDELKCKRVSKDLNCFGINHRLQTSRMVDDGVLLEHEGIEI